MKENKYDDNIFFQKYSQMSRSQQGLAGAGEWETLRKLLPDFKDKRVLDLGCGYGWHCIYAMEHGASSVVGVDISHKMLEVAKEKTYPSEKSRLLNSIFTCELCGKNAMFNLNENNRIVMAQHPTDMRMGVNCLSGQVRMVGLDPSNGDVYIFVGKSRQVMKILHWEYGGYVVYYKRLEEGRFHPRIFLRQGVGFRSMKWSELVLLMEGISPKAARRHRYEKS